MHNTIILTTNLLQVEHTSYLITASFVAAAKIINEMNVGGHFNTRMLLGQRLQDAVTTTGQHRITTSVLGHIAMHSIQCWQFLS